MIISMIHPDKLTGRLGNKMFQYAYLYAQERDGTIPDIYLQDPMYFERYKSEIKHIFGGGIMPISQVAIHVRRGDYVDNPFYVDLTQTDYYDRAMKLFPNDTFLVFSDDIEWCKGYFTGSQFEFSEGNDDVTDMNLMAGCKGVIMANSSFSWWAAYLSKGKVIAPKEWFTDGVERTKCPPEWKRV
jgi:hypothetical protein